MDDVGAEKNKISNLRTTGPFRHGAQWDDLNWCGVTDWRIERNTGETHLKLPFCHKVGAEQGAGQQARSDDEVLRLVEEGQ